MLKLIMIRHGKTYGNTLGRYIGVTDEPLLPKEAEELKQYALPVMNAVYTSPLKRCVQTAEILFPDNKAVLVPDLRECDFGEFENKNYQELSDNPNYQAWVDSGGTTAFPGGEDRWKFQERCVAGFETIIREAVVKEWEQIALVVHGGTIMAILDRYGIPKADYFSWHVNNGEGYSLRLNAEQYLSGKKELVVDGKFLRIVQDQEETESFLFEPADGALAETDSAEIASTETDKENAAGEEAEE